MTAAVATSPDELLDALALVLGRLRTDIDGRHAELKGLISSVSSALDQTVAKVADQKAAVDQRLGPLEAGLREDLTELGKACADDLAVAVAAINERLAGMLKTIEAAANSASAQDARLADMRTEMDAALARGREIVAGHHTELAEAFKLIGDQGEAIRTEIKSVEDAAALSIAVQAGRMDALDAELRKALDDRLADAEAHVRAIVADLPAPPEVDLSGLDDQIAKLRARADELEAGIADAHRIVIGWRAEDAATVERQISEAISAGLNSVEAEDRISLRTLRLDHLETLHRLERQSEDLFARMKEVTAKVECDGNMLAKWLADERGAFAQLRADGWKEITDAIAEAVAKTAVDGEQLFREALAAEIVAFGEAAAATISAEVARLAEANEVALQEKRDSLNALYTAAVAKIEDKNAAQMGAISEMLLARITELEAEVAKSVDESADAVGGGIARLRHEIALDRADLVEEKQKADAELEQSRDRFVKALNSTSIKLPRFKPEGFFS